MANELVLLDNDIIFKASAWRLAEPALILFELRNETAAALGVSRYVLPTKIQRSRTIADKARASTELDKLIASLQFLEPDADEVALAAELEEDARNAGLILDTGESLLVAVLVNRALKGMMTGDKHAIVVLEELFARNKTLASIKERLHCLEQFVVELLRLLQRECLRNSVCAEPNVDRAVSICFSCSAGTLPDDAPQAGLLSYIRNLQAGAKSVMHGSNGLSLVA